LIDKQAAVASEKQRASLVKRVGVLGQLPAICSSIEGAEEKD